jgi:hypothetical protein
VEWGVPSVGCKCNQCDFAPHVAHGMPKSKTINLKI